MASGLHSQPVALEENQSAHPNGPDDQHHRLPHPECSILGPWFAGLAPEQAVPDRRSPRSSHAGAPRGGLPEVAGLEPATTGLLIVCYPISRVADHDRWPAPDQYLAARCVAAVPGLFHSAMRPKPLHGIARLGLIQPPASPQDSFSRLAAIATLPKDSGLPRSHGAGRAHDEADRNARITPYLRVHPDEWLAIR